MTDRLTVIHAADLHLDSPFAALSPAAAAVRRQEQREILAAIFDEAKNRKAQLVLLSGDLLDSDNAYFETCDCLRTLCAASDARVIIAPGNHDYYSQTSPYGAMVWPENVHIFRSSKITALELPELNLRVYGAAFIKSSASSMLEDFRAKRDGMISIMCIHGSLEPGQYNTITKEQISASGLDYLALGHIHKTSGILREGETFYGWPGCPMGRGFDETGEKGIFAGTIASGDCRMEFVPLKGRKYEAMTVDVTDKDPLEAILSAIPGSTERDVYRLDLAGFRETPPDTAALKTALNDRFFGLELRDRTQPPRSIWEGEDCLTLRGEFLRGMKARWEAAEDDEQRKQIELAVRFGLAALDKREVPKA